MSTVERVLVLHYLACAFRVVPTGQWISFRNLPGGQFYWGPFRARTTAPLTRRFGNDLHALRTNLSRFDYELLPDVCPSSADLAARVHALGRIAIALIYRTGDEETAPDAEVLFDESLKRVFNTEDAVAHAHLNCMGLM
jgi:hypothetical protein